MGITRAWGTGLFLRFLYLSGKLGHILVCLSLCYLICLMCLVGISIGIHVSLIIVLYWFLGISGVARARSLVGHKYDKWSLVAISLTTPQINSAESQSIAYNLDYFCPILIELRG